MDGERAAVVPLNGYLGAALAAQTYEFVFRLRSAFAGIGMSSLALALCIGLLIAERRGAPGNTGPKRPVNVTTLTPAKAGLKRRRPRSVGPFTGRRCVARWLRPGAGTPAAGSSHTRPDAYNRPSIDPAYPVNSM